MFSAEVSDRQGRRKSNSNSALATIAFSLTPTFSLRTRDAIVPGGVDQAVRGASRRGERLKTSFECLRKSILGPALLQFALALPVVAGPLSAAAEEPQKIVEEAAETVREFLENEARFPKLRPVLERAKGVLVLPKVFRYGVFVGAFLRAKGVLIARDSGPDGWGRPVFVELSERHWGIEPRTELGSAVLAVMTDDGLDRLLSSDAVLGTDVDLVPIAEYQAEADVIAFARTDHEKLVLAFTDVKVSVNEAANRTYYGVRVSAGDIVRDGRTPDPSADVLRATLAPL